MTSGSFLGVTKIWICLLIPIVTITIMKCTDKYVHGFNKQFGKLYKAIHMHHAMVCIIMLHVIHDKS